MKHDYDDGDWRQLWKPNNPFLAIAKQQQHRMIENLKDLERLLKLCRKQGVTDVTIGTLSLKFGELPERHVASGSIDEMEMEDKFADFPDGELSQEELTFFANGGDPKDNPYRQDK